MTMHITVLLSSHLEVKSVDDHVIHRPRHAELHYDPLISLIKVRRSIQLSTKKDLRI